MRLFTTFVLLGASLATLATEGVQTSGEGHFSSLRGLPSNSLEIIGKENPCEVGSTRLRTSITLENQDVDKDSIYAGVTPEGDIATIQKHNGKTVLDMYICSRPDMAGQGTISRKFTTQVSLQCNIDEIIGDVMIETTSDYGSYMLAFAPIDVIGTERKSSLCHQGTDLSLTNSALSGAQRFELKEVKTEDNQNDSTVTNAQVTIE